MAKKQIPLGIMHEPKPMAWARLTTQSEIESLQPAENITSGESLDVSRATTELRRAYPYIFDCAAYALTHNPNKIEYDLFYARFNMPYEVFLNYCLDDCTEQTQYLKEELYKLMKGQPAKYIKVSQKKSVFGQPVVIIFGHIDPETKKERRIANIGKDQLVNTVQIQIIKELLDNTHGYVNLPKAFYAKTRRTYNALKKINPAEQAKHIKSLDTKLGTNIYALIGTKKIASDLENKLKDLETLEQGGFHEIHAAVEYILVNHKDRLNTQNYDFLLLCQHCKPALTRTESGKLYFKDMEKVKHFCVILQMFLTLTPAEIPIKSVHFNDALRTLTVEFQ